MLAKILGTQSNTFAASRVLLTELAALAEEQPSCNGIYLALPDYLNVSEIGTSAGLLVENWYDLKGSTNYLFATGTSRPTLVPSDSLFNNKPSILFSSTGDKLLRFKFPIKVGTMVIVYAAKQLGGYILYAPKTKGVPPNLIYYDGAPSGASTLWAPASSDPNPLFTSTSRINGQEVLPTAPTTLNSVRILSIKDIDTPEGVIEISGLGARTGVGDAPVQVDGVKGNIAAVLCFEDNLSDEALFSLESLAAQLYVNYTGPVSISTPDFKYLVNSGISINFSQYIVDEFFAITNYSIVTPSSTVLPDLSFTGSVLSGNLSDTYKGPLEIEVLNSSGFVKRFVFGLEVVKADPIVYTFPQIPDLNLALSAGNDGAGNTYGVYLDDAGKVTAWEDARRLTSAANPFYTFYKDSAKPSPTYVVEDPVFYDKGSVSFGSSDFLQLQAQAVPSSTSIWLYVQKSNGFRELHSGLNDIYGQGQLWTVATLSEIHGSTSTTSQKGYVNKIRVNTLNYKLPLNNLYFIVARDANLNFNSFEGIRGNLAYFLSWDVALSEAQVAAAIASLSSVYVEDDLPYIHNQSTEYRYVSNVQVDLSTKVSDLFNRTLTYNITSNHYSATISGNILSFTAVTDEVLEFVIEVSADGGLTHRVLTFDIDIALRDSALYLAVKQWTQVQDSGYELGLVLLPEADTFSLSGSNVIYWEDYRLNGFTANATGVALASAEHNLEYETVFGLDGNSLLDFSSPVAGKTFISVFVSPVTASGSSLLFGQDADNKFFTGSLPNVLQSGVDYSHFQNIVCNGQSLNYTTGYALPRNVINIVTYTSISALSVDSIAKDRAFTGSSLKGNLLCSFILNETVTVAQSKELQRIIYYEINSPKYVTVLNFDGNLIDVSVKGKIASGTATTVTNTRKFGTHSLELYTSSTSKYLAIPNESDYATLSYPFTSGFWLACSKASDNSEVIRLVTYPNLYLSLIGSKLTLDNNGVGSTPYISHTLPSFSISTFRHIELSRDLLNVLRLYVDGIKVGEYDLSSLPINAREYTDTVSPILLGSPNNLATTVFTARVDSFMFYINDALHTANFTPPAGAYPA